MVGRPSQASGMTGDRLPRRGALRQRDIIFAEWKAHWPTGLATILGLGLGISIFANIFSLFIEPLQHAFGWSRGQIALVQNVSFLVALATPVAGRMIDRFGVRWLLIGAFAIMSGLWIGLALMPGPLWVFYGLYGLLTVIGIPTSGMGFSRAVNAVFVRSRGFSLAVGRSGLALYAAGLPLILYAAISRWGFRGGYAVMALLTVCVALPAVCFGIERGRASLTKGQTASVPLVPWRSLVTNRRVIAISAASALSFMPLLAVISQLHPLLTGYGLQPEKAAGMVGLLGIAALVGALCTGVFLDRFWAPAVAATVMAGSAFGMVCLIFAEHHPALATVGIILIGAAQGSEIDIMAYLVSRYFGMAAFGSIFSLGSVCITLASALSVSSIGLLYDATGSYRLALIIGVGLFLASSATYLTLGAYPERD